LTEGEMEDMRRLIRVAIARSKLERELEFSVSACGGKQGFASFDEARTKIRWEVRGIVQPFHCETCGKWHLGGARSGRERRAISMRVKYRHENHRRGR
jgi:hypothetical protein